jgi:hypothetical protein
MFPMFALTAVFLGESVALRGESVALPVARAAQRKGKRPGWKERVIG